MRTGARPATDRAPRADPHVENVTRALDARIDQLRARSDGTSRLHLALLLWMRGGPESRGAERAEAIVAAGMARPDDPLLAWMEAYECHDAGVCDRAGAVRRLQRLDADNVAVWLADLDTLGANATPAQIDAVLERAARASTYDLYWPRLSEAMGRALEGVALPSADDPAFRAHLRILGLRGAVPRDMPSVETRTTAMTSAAIPAYKPVMQACDPAARISAARFDACMRVLDVMGRGDETVAVMIGLRRGIGLQAQRPAQAQWRERLRQLEWDREAMRRAENDVDYVRWFLLHGELRAIDAWHRARRVPRDAPPGWLPRDPRVRHIVVTGTEPPKPRR